MQVIHLFNRIFSLNKYIQANTDGRLHDANEPAVSPLNRGFLYGDAVYEVWRTYEGTLFAFQEHMDRLRRSAAALHMQVPFDESVLLTEIRRTVSAFFEITGEKKQLYVRLQLSRGAGPIGLDTGLADQPSYTILVQNLKERGEESLKKGISLALAKSLHRNHPRTLNPAWKTGNYLNNILCLREARAKGADDVVMTNLDGAVTEASTMNLFFVNGKEILTPPASAGILEGITRRILLDEVAQNWDYDLREETVLPSQLGDFSECFVSSTTQDIIPVGSIDKVTYKVGAKTVGRQVKTIFLKYVKDYCGRHPELKIF